MKVSSEIQKWGNGLALRVSGAMREIPGIEVGTPVEIDIREDGFSVKIIPDNKTTPILFDEKELLAGIDAHLAHADERPSLISDEYE